MPDTQKKIEGFVEEEKKYVERSAYMMSEDGAKGYFDAVLRRAIAFGLRLSCEMGPEKRPERWTENAMPMYSEKNVAFNTALTARDKACLEEAERVEKGVIL